METFDVIVLGTGAAALSAAIRAAAEGATVGLFEKADTVGGTSAWSGVTALEDKLVQRATVEVLNSIYETDFLGFSYGAPRDQCGDARIRLDNQAELIPT